MTSPSESLPAVGWSWNPAGIRLRAVIPVAAALFAVVLVAAVAYTVGARRNSTHVATGYAFASPLQISASAGGWTYDIPLTVNWRDSKGGLHEGSRPACLPASSQRQPVTFAWVPVKAGSSSWRTVAWVDCG